MYPCAHDLSLSHTFRILNACFILCFIFDGLFSSVLLTYFSTWVCTILIPFQVTAGFSSVAVFLDVSFDTLLKAFTSCQILSHHLMIPRVSLFQGMYFIFALILFCICLIYVFSFILNSFMSIYDLLNLKWSTRVITLGFLF